MELIAKAPQTLSAGKNSDEILSKAKTDHTGTPPRLPLELLIDIIAQLPSRRGACSFARVNKALHCYSIRCIYANFTVETRGMLHVADHLDRDDYWIHAHSSISEMLQIFDAKGAKNLYGLFSRPEHLMAVRHLMVTNAILWDHRKMPSTRAIVSKIVKEIFNGATALQTADVNDSVSHDAALPFCLENISYAHTFTSLSIASLSLGTWKTIFQDVPSLKEISCDHLSRDFLQVTGSEYANHRIEALTYRWCPKISEGSLDVKGDIYSWLPIAMPNLRRLSIQHILRARRSDDSDVVGVYLPIPSTSYGAISKQIRDHCVSLVQNLRNLQDFTMTLDVVGEIEITPMADQGAYTELEREVVMEEVQLVKQLSIGNLALICVTVGNSWNWAGVIRTFEIFTLWKKIGTSLSEKGDEMVIWTPQPYLEPYWWLWFAEYRTPQHVREMMVKHWEPESDIPSLLELECWYSQNPIAN